MSKTQVLVLWIIAALLGIAVAAVKNSQRRSSDGTTAIARGGVLLDGFPPRQVARVTIKGHGQSATVRRDGDHWVVDERDNYPANLPMLGSFLNTLADLKVVQGLEAGPDFDHRFGMDANAREAAEHGLHLTFEDAGGESLATIQLGKTSASSAAMDPFSMMGRNNTGRYIRTGTDPDSVYIIEETFPRISANPKDWLSEEFLQVANIRRITLTATDDDSFSPWSLVRPDVNGDFTTGDLTAAEEMNTNATNPLKNLFSFARFEDLMSTEAAKDLRDLTQDRRVVINTFDGFTYTIDLAPKLAAPPADGEPVAPGTGNENYLATIQVSAEFPEKRTPAADEKPEDAKQRDEAFTQRREALQKQLASQKELEGYVYEVARYTVDPLIKTRTDLVQAKPAPAPTAPPMPAPNPNPPFLQP